MYEYFHCLAEEDENGVKTTVTGKVVRRIEVGVDETDENRRPHADHLPTSVRENVQGPGREVAPALGRHGRILGPSPLRGRTVDRSREHL